MCVFRSLIIVFFSIFLFSCKDDISSIGIDVLPDEMPNVLKIDSVTVLPAIDSTSEQMTYFTDIVHLGEFNDPYYGNYKASFFTNILTIDSIDISSYKYVEAWINLDLSKLQGQKVGNGIYNLSAYKVTKDISRNVSSYPLNFDIDSYCDLSKPVFSVVDTFKYDVVNTLKTKIDTKLNNNEFIKELFSADSLTLNDSSKFLTRFKGLLFKMTLVNKNDTGAIFYLNLKANDTTYITNNIEIRYKLSDTSTKFKSRFYTFYYLQFVNKSYFTINFSNIKRDYSKSKVKKLIFDEFKDNIYFSQGFGGYKIGCHFPFLKNFRNNKKYIIYKAEIQLPLAYYSKVGTDSLTYISTRPALTPYIKNGAKMEHFYSKYIPNDRAFYTSYYPNNLHSTVNVTQYVQSYINGETNDDKIYFDHNYNSNEIKCQLFDLNKPKLIIYYSEK